MARNVTPGNPPKIEANLVNVKAPDFSAFDKLGDAQINAANTNFKLYADNLIKTESAKLYEKYKTDPIQLTNALAKLPEMLKGLPEEIQDEMNAKLYLQGVSLVQKANNNKLVQTDIQNKQLTDAGINQSKATLAETYQNILQNHISPAEKKDEVMNDIFLQERMNLNNYADLKDYNGKNVYSESQRKQISNIDDLELEGFKKFFDTMLLNDNDELQNSKDYYTKFLLAPERFMAENYMNRDTYDKARAYAEKELKRAGAEIKSAKFNQSYDEAMALQVEDLPGVKQRLKDSGIIDKSFIKNIEKTTAKFSTIDPSVVESPVVMLDMLSIVNSWDAAPAQTEQEKLEVLATGTMALDLLATYGQKYGMSEKTINQAKQMVVMKEQNELYGNMIKNFGEITQSFGIKIDGVTEKLKSVQKDDTGSIDKKEIQKLTKLNQILAVAEDLSRNAIRTGNMEEYNRIQKELSFSVAQLKYEDYLLGQDWVDWQQNPETPFSLPDGSIIYISSVTPLGDIIIKQ